MLTPLNSKDNTPMDDTRLLTRIALLYYKVGLTQAEVATRLGLSRQTVGRHLKRAEALGLVEVQIHSPYLVSAERDHRLEETFGLVEAVVAQPPASTPEAIKEAIGAAGAEFLQRRVQPGDVIGVSWSSTVLECAMHLERTESRRVTVVQMNGSLDRTAYSTRAEFTVDRIAKAFDGEAITVVVPMMVDRPEIKDSLMSDSRVAAALDLAGRADIAVFGVGNVSESSSLFKAGYLNQEMLDRLNERQAIGDICGRFFDAHGRVAVPEFDERTMAVPLDRLRSVKLSVAMAGGPEKVDALLGVLRGGLCKALVTDEDTANALLASGG